jgi:hypothetical protein
VRSADPFPCLLAARLRRASQRDCGKHGRPRFRAAFSFGDAGARTNVICHSSEMAQAVAVIPSAGRRIEGGMADKQSVDSLPTDAGIAMPGSTEKSKRYLWLARENERRATGTSHPPLKALFLKLASEYRHLAEQIDDPVQWGTKHIASKPQGARHLP